MPAKNSGEADSEAFSPFIVSTSLSREDPDTRKFIRSHVMRGKNKGKKMPRKPKVQGAPDPATRSTPSHLYQENSKRSGSGGAEHDWALVPLRKVASELSLWSHTAELNPSTRQLIHLAYTVVKPSIYSVQVFGSGDADSDVFCFANLSIHPAMIPSLIFTVQAFQATIWGMGVQNDAHMHLAKALNLLQQSLNDKERATSYSTMVVVASLATAAIIVGDLESTKKHMDGLQRILEVGGGLKSLDEGSMVAYKAQTIDLWLTMATGNQLRFPQSVSWSPQVADRRSASRFPELDMIHPRPDPRLLNVWADLRELSRMANDVAVSRMGMPPGGFRHVSTAIPYRLLQLQYDSSSPSELLRLCMVAYTKTLVVRVGGFGKSMLFLKEKLDTSICKWMATTSGSSPLLLWVLFVAAISIFEDMPTEPHWLRTSLLDTIASLDLRSWPETRSILKTFLWIGVLHDDLAKVLFEELLAVVVQERGVQTVSLAELMIA